MTQTVETPPPPGKHHVIASSLEESARYIDKGYRVSQMSLREKLGLAAWSMLAPTEREGLVVLEIDAAEHTAQNSLPRKHRERAFCKDYLYDVRVDEVEILEAGPRQRIVATLGSVNPNTQFAGGAEGCDSYELHETRAEAAQALASRAREEIDRHREAIENLERFLRENL